MKYPKLTAALMSGALALSIGLVGCGGGSQSTATETAQSTASETSATSTTSTTPTTDSSSTTSSTTESTNTWSNCYMGVSEAGENFFYAEDQTDPNNPTGLMIVLNPDTSQYISFVGPLSNPSDTQVTIQDTTTGNSITFEVEAVADGGLLVDLGDTGKAVLAECSADEITNAIAIVDTFGEALA